MVRDNPVNTGNHAAPASRAAAIQHPDRLERDGLGYAVRRPSDRARHVRTVPVAIVAVATKGIVTERCAPAKLSVAVVDSGIDDVSGDAATGEVLGVAVVQRQCPLVDPVESAGRRGLRGVERDGLVSLDVGNIRVATQRLERPGGQDRREPL